VITGRRYLAVRKEREATHRITRAMRSWDAAESENPTLLPITA
jgi:hypothetical protein